MKNEKFAVLNHEYINTGGSTMVSVFTVHCYGTDTTRFVIANEEGFNLQTADTVTCEYDDDMIDDIILGSWQWDALVFGCREFDGYEFELYKYCQFEFYKKDCKYFNTKYRVDIEELPDDLLHTLTAEYILWAKEEGVGCLTDGYRVFLDDYYTAVN